MPSREAKDFLVQQTVEQARLEGVPFSDLEKRMMYFTEGKDALEDPVTLNDEFESEYDSGEFEKKASGLMRRAFKRLKKEAPEKAIEWTRAVRSLRRGDHYILVLAGQHLSHGSPHYWRLLGVFFVPLISFYLFAFLFSPGGRTGLRYPYWHTLPLISPSTLRVVQVLYFSLLLAAIFVPKIFEPANKHLCRCMDWVIGLKERDER